MSSRDHQIQTKTSTYGPAGISKISNFDNWYGGQVKWCAATLFLTINSLYKNNPSLKTYHSES